MSDKKTNAISAALGLVLFATAPEILCASGSTSLDFLRLDIGPRQVGMGGAGVALGDDVYSMAANPALLSELGSQQAGFSYVNWLQSVNYQDLLYALPTPYGSFGGRFENLSYGTFQGYDAVGANTGGVTAGDFLAAFGYAHSLPGLHAAAGANLVFAQESIGDAKARTGLMDLGAVWHPFSDGRLETFSLGLAVKHIGSSVKFDQTREPLPRTIDAGAGMRFLDDALRTALDFHITPERDPYADAGIEYWFQQQIALRAGYETRQDQGPGIRAGVGFRVSGAEINYAFMPMGDLGMTHHIGIVFRFASPADKVFREGVRLLNQNRPAEAILKFDEALRLDPRHPEAGIWLRRAYRRIQNAVHEEGGVLKP